MSKTPKEKILNPTVVKLGLVSFFADVSSEMLYPITPIFLTTVLGASMTSLGLIEGLAEAVASLMKTYSGIWSDRMSNRKSFIFAGYLLAAVAKPMIGFSNNWSQVLFARSLDRSGKGLRSAPRDALLADSVSQQGRGEAFGWHRAMDTMGAALGPLLALYFMSVKPDDLRSIYYWALIPGLLSVAVVLLVHDKKINPAKAKSKVSFNFFKEWNTLSPKFKNYLYAWGLFSLANSSDVFLLLKAKDAGLSTTAVILLYCGYNLVYSLTSPYLGKLSDKIERKKILIFGLIMFVIVYLGFGFLKTVEEFIFLFLIYGLYMAATDGVGKAVAVDLAPKDKKATCLGLLGTVTGLATIIASLAAGLLWDYVGASSAFFYGAAGALVAIMVLLFSDFNMRKIGTV